MHKIFLKGYIRTGGKDSINIIGVLGGEGDWIFKILCYVYEFPNLKK